MQLPCPSQAGHQRGRNRFSGRRLIEAEALGGEGTWLPAVHRHRGATGPWSWGHLPSSPVPSARAVGPSPRLHSAPTSPLLSAHKSHRHLKVLPRGYLYDNNEEKVAVGQLPEGMQMPDLRNFLWATASLAMTVLSAHVAHWRGCRLRLQLWPRDQPT